MDKMQWKISVPIFKNTVILKQLGIAVGIPFGLVAWIIGPRSGKSVYALYGLGLIAGLLFFTWLFIMAVYRGKYENEFVLDDKGALCRTQAKQAKSHTILLCSEWTAQLAFCTIEAKLGRMKNILFVAILLLTALPLSSCALLLPSPTDEQVLQAVAVSNEAESEPLELVYEEMQVPHRYPGRASAVIWVPDKSVQRNFTIAYDKKAKTFHVESFITLWLGEDGVYRNEQP